MITSSVWSGGMKLCPSPASMKVFSSGPARVASLLTAMTAGTPQILQMRSTPMAEPMASRSLMRWPIMMTLSLFLIRSHKALAMMRLRHDCAFDTVGDTSVEFKAVYGLDSRPWSPPRPRAISMLTGHLVTFLQSLAAVTYADGQRGKAAGMQRAHLVKNFKPLLQHPVDIAFLHYRNVAAIGDLAQETGAFGDVRFPNRLLIDSSSLACSLSFMSSNSSS